MARKTVVSRRREKSTTKKTAKKTPARKSSTTKSRAKKMSASRKETASKKSRSDKKSSTDKASQTEIRHKRQFVKRWWKGTPYVQSEEKAWWCIYERTENFANKIQEWENKSASDVAQLAKKDEKLTELREQHRGMEKLVRQDSVDPTLMRWLSPLIDEHATEEQKQKLKSWAEGPKPRGSYSNVPLDEDETPLPEQTSESSNALKKLPMPSVRDAKLALKACEKIRANGMRLSGRKVSDESTVSRPKIKAMCLLDMLPNDIKKEILSRSKS